MQTILQRLKGLDGAALKRMADDAEATVARLTGRYNTDRLDRLEHEVEKLNHWIMGINVVVGDMNESLFGDRRGYGKDGSGPGWAPGGDTCGD